MLDSKKIYEDISGQNNLVLQLSTFSFFFFCNATSSSDKLAKNCLLKAVLS